MLLNFENSVTSGRIHSSMISGINLDTKSVTVEWYENGETKGKEVKMYKICVGYCKISMEQDVLKGHNHAKKNQTNVSHLDLTSLENKVFQSYCMAKKMLSIFLRGVGWGLGL